MTQLPAAARCGSNNTTLEQIIYHSIFSWFEVYYYIRITIDLLFFVAIQKKIITNTKIEMLTCIFFFATAALMLVFLFIGSIDFYII